MKALFVFQFFASFPFFDKYLPRNLFSRFVLYKNTSMEQFTLSVFIKECWKLRTKCKCHFTVVVLFRFICFGASVFLKCPHVHIVHYVHTCSSLNLNGNDESERCFQGTEFFVCLTDSGLTMRQFTSYTCLRYRWERIHIYVNSPGNGRVICGSLLVSNVLSLKQGFIG